MAGDNQHFIPQFLQRGFASHKEGNTAYTWEYRRHVAPQNQRIKEVGAEPKFYTEPGDTAVDEAITRAENNYGNLIHRLRAGPPGPVSEPLIPEFIAHLEIRTRHLRQSFLQGVDYIVARIVDLMDDTDRFLPLVQSRTAAELRHRTIAEVRKRRNAPRDINAEVNRLVKLAKKHVPDAIETIKPQIVALAAALRAQLPALVADATKRGHLAALKQTIAPLARSQSVAGLKFRIREVAEGTLVLGDSALLFSIDGPRPFQPYTEKGDPICAVFLPFASDRILIGERTPTDWPIDLLIHQIARCSLEYFIADKSTAENVILANEIGVDAQLLPGRELEEIALNLFQDRRKIQGEA
jgi:hypothetical protein